VVTETTPWGGAVCDTRPKLGSSVTNRRMTTDNFAKTSDHLNLVEDNLGVSLY
jgi:hypothetical protein